MTRRILSIELRRTVAPLLAVLFVALGAAMLYAVARYWSGRWTSMAMQQREYLFVLWPLTAAAGAWQGRREARTRSRELLATTARPRWQRAGQTAAALAIASVAGYLGMFAAGAVRAAPEAGYLPKGLLPIVAVGTLSVLTAVWLGLAVGSRLPSRLTPPAVLVGGLLVMMVLPAAFHELSAPGRDDPMVLLLSPVLSGRAGDFTTVSGRVHLGQAVWLAALALAGLLLLAWMRRAATVAALLSTVLGAALALAVLPDHEDDVMVLDPASTVLTCTADTPKVCVTKVHAAALAGLTPPARQALGVLAARLPDPPTTVVEAHTWWQAEDRQPQPADTVLIDLSYSFRLAFRYTSRDLVWMLLDGAGTRPCPNAFEILKHEWDKYHAARLAAAAWLLGEPPQAGRDTAGDPQTARPIWERLNALPAQEARARVNALRRAALACDNHDLIGILNGGSGAK